MCSYGVGLHILVHSSSQAGLLAGSEHSGIGGLLHVARVRCESVRNRVHMAQGILECISNLNYSRGQHGILCQLQRHIFPYQI